MTEQQAKRLKRKKKKRMRKILSWSIVIATLIAIIFLFVFLISFISKLSGGKTKDAIRLPVETTSESGQSDENGISSEVRHETSSTDVSTSDTSTADTMSNTVESTTAAASEAETTTASQTATETTTASQTTETTTASSAASLPSNVSGSQLNAADFANYSTEKVPYGFGSEVDADNRPDGCTWYTNKFSNYTALFIMPKSSNIYLTFDEGYEYGFSGEILDVLKEKNVKAVFFVTLPYARDNPELVQRMIDEGHIVGNHTTTHPSGGLQQYDAQKQIDDIDQVTQYVKEHYGYSMNLFRFPEGSFSEQSLAIVNALGYTPVFWSFAYKDWDVNNQPDVSESLTNALNKAHGGAIYLLHAESQTNTKMLPDLIDGLRSKGYSLELLNY